MLACLKAASGAELTEDDVRHLRSWEASYHDAPPPYWREHPHEWRLYALKQLKTEWSK
jgi:hypothetical protein